MANPSKEARKAAIAAYKEKKTKSGIYAIRCSGTGAIWVGQAPDLATIWNRYLFELNARTCRSQTLQNAWIAEEGRGLSFEVLEEIDTEKMTYERERVFKERTEHWRKNLNALFVL